MEYQLNLRKIFDALFKKKWIVSAIGIIALLSSFMLVSGNRSDMYAASSSIYAASSTSYQESVQGMNIMRDYVNVIRSRKVADRASGYMSQVVSAEQIMGMVSANYEIDSKIITITARSSDPEIAISVANAVADAFIQEIVSITAVESIKVLDSAHSARLVINARDEAMKNRIIMTAAAVAVTIGVIVLITIFDNKVVFPIEATLDGKIELLGIIPEKTI